MSEDVAGRVPFNLPFIVGKELHYIAQAVTRESHLSGDGHFTGRCHEWIESHLGAARCLLTHSCTAALEMAAILAGIEPGDEVIMPSFTFVSTANAFVARGGVPVFVDVRADTLNLDERLIEAAVTDRTRAVVAVHYAGIACEMDTITDVARAHRLWVIEDAAQAFLSTYGGRHLGTIGDLGCLSFHETKNIISGEGGALLVNDPKLNERAEIIRDKGTNRAKFFRGEIDKYTWVDIGSSYLPSELVGAFLFAQLEMSGAINENRTRVFRRYQKGLAPVEEAGYARLPRIGPRSVHNGHLFYLLTGSARERRALVGFLGDRGVAAVHHYVPLHSSPAGRRFGRSSGRLPVTEDVSERLLRLPLFYGMTDEQIEQVVQAVLAFYGLPM